MQKNNTKLVLKLIDDFNQMDMERITDSFSDDAVYHNIPLEVITGRESIRVALETFLAGATAVHWTLLNIAENDQGQVFTERIDQFEFGDNKIAIAVMGVFEFQNHKISEWRDYFDLAQFQSQLEPQPS